MIATLLITIGWIFTVLNPELEVEEGAFMLNLLEPRPPPIVFAFLGAYMFTLMALLRAYVRSDLRPKPYTHATARIIVAASAWVLELLFIDAASSPATTGNEGLLVLAFVIGYFSETARAGTGFDRRYRARARAAGRHEAQHRDGEWRRRAKGSTVVGRPRVPPAGSPG